MVLPMLNNSDYFVSLHIMSIYHNGKFQSFDWALVVAIVW